MLDERSRIKSSALYKSLKRLLCKHDLVQGDGCGLTDAIADLRHDQDFDDHCRIALGHYLAELQSAREAQVRRDNRKQRAAS